MNQTKSSFKLQNEYWSAALKSDRAYIGPRNQYQNNQKYMICFSRQKPTVKNKIFATSAMRER